MEKHNTSWGKEMKHTSTLLIVFILTIGHIVVYGNEESEEIGLNLAPLSQQNIWKDEFNNETFIQSKIKGDNAYNGPAFTIENGTIFPGLVRGLNQVDSNTIALWDFNDDDSPSKLNDSSNNGKHGTLHNMYSGDWVDGIEGSALDFDGTNDYVKVPWSNVLNPSRITVEAWIYPHSLPPQFGNEGFIVHKRVGYFMMLGQFTIETPSVQDANAKSLIQKNKWQYLVGTYDGSNVKLFLNGNLVATKASSTGMTHYNNPLFIGCYDGGSYLSYPYDGLLDEIKMSNKALSGQTIKRNYNSYYAWKYGLRNTDVHVVSKAIDIPSNHYWKDLNVSKMCPSGSTIQVTILDASNNQPIPGFLNINRNNFDISGLDPVKYPSIKLSGNFTSNDNYYPTLDSWSVSWRENIDPEILDVQTPVIVTRTNVTTIYISAEDPDQFNGDLSIQVLSRSSKHLDWTQYAIGDGIYDDQSGEFHIGFDTKAGYDLGYYSFKVKVTDHLGSSDSVILVNSTKVYSEKVLNISLLDHGINITRDHETLLSLDPDLDGPLNEVNLTIDILYNDNEVDWFTEPILIDGKWEFKINPLMESSLGYYDISVDASSNNFYKFHTVIKDAFIIVNRIPTISTIPTLHFDEDQIPEMILDCSEYIYDNETDISNLELSLINQSDPENLSVFIEDKEIYLDYYRENWSGEVEVELEVFDDYNYSRRFFGIVVTPVQDLPVLDPIPDMVLLEEEQLVYDFNASDVDPNDSLSYYLKLGELDTLVADFEGYSFDTSTGILSLQATNDLVGSYELNISVFDGKDRTWTHFNLEIININDPPVWDTVGDRSVERRELDFSVDQDQKKSIELEGSDIDNLTEELRFILDSGPDFGVIEENMLVLSPRWDDVGIHTFVVNVTDGEYQVPINITVEVKNIPDPPVAVIEDVPDKIPEGQMIVLNGTGSYDLDPGTELSYVWKSNISGNIGYEEVIEPLLEPGYHEITLTVKDGNSLSSDAVVNVQIEKVMIPPDDDDISGDDDDINETSKEKGSINVLLFGGIIAGVILIVLVIIILLMVGKRKPSEETDINSEKEEIAEKDNGSQETKDSEVETMNEEPISNVTSNNVEEPSISQGVKIEKDTK